MYINLISSSGVLALGKLGHTYPNDGAQLPGFVWIDIMASLEKSLCVIPTSATPCMVIL